MLLPCQAARDSDAGVASAVLKRLNATRARRLLSAPGLPWWCHRGAGASLVQVQAILVGSKTDPTARMIVKDEAMREALATFAEDMAPRVFFSGKAGWHTLGKINVDGQRSPHKPSCWTSRRNTPVTGVLRARVPTIQARCHRPFSHGSSQKKGTGRA